MSIVSAVKLNSFSTHVFVEVWKQYMLLSEKSYLFIDADLITEVLKKDSIHRGWKISRFVMNKSVILELSPQTDTNWQQEIKLTMDSSFEYLL